MLRRFSGFFSSLIFLSALSACGGPEFCLDFPALKEGWERWNYPSRPDTQGLYSIGVPIPAGWQHVDKHNLVEEQEATLKAIMEAPPLIRDQFNASNKVFLGAWDPRLASHQDATQAEIDGVIAQNIEIRKENAKIRERNAAVIAENVIRLRRGAKRLPLEPLKDELPLRTGNTNSFMGFYLQYNSGHRNHWSTMAFDICGELSGFSTSPSCRNEFAKLNPDYDHSQVDYEVSEGFPTACRRICDRMQSPQGGIDANRILDNYESNFVASIDAVNREMVLFEASQIGYNVQFNEAQSGLREVGREQGYVLYYSLTLNGNRGPDVIDVIIPLGKSIAYLKFFLSLPDQSQLEQVRPLVLEIVDGIVVYPNYTCDAFEELDDAEADI